MPVRRIYALTFVGGAASLGGEIAAARLMAPWFGDSTLIWANTIGIVLVALSVGYWLGGKLADRDPDLRHLAYIILAAASLFALLPFVARPFLRVSVDALNSVSAGAFVGSLVAVLVLLAVPMLLLGTISPYVVKLAIRSVDEAGRVTGRLYAISTLGSLFGTFISSLVLIPFLGTRRTFLLFALALAIVATIALGRRFAPAPILIAVLLALPVGTVKAVENGKVIWEKETLYQYAVVIEDDDGERRLELNEGQAVHSVFEPGRWITGNYWDEFLTLPFAARPDARPLRSVAILGNAAGTVARQYGHYFPDTKVDGVEIDGELNEIARSLFDLNERDAPNVRLHTADGRPWLRASDKRFDAIFVDAYRQPYVPFHLATREFFQLVKEHLNPGGVVLVNIGHPESSTALEEVLTATMADVFSTVVRDPSQDVNTIAMATDAQVSPAALRAAVPDLHRDLQPIARATADQIGPRLAGGKVYTDDVAPVEWLIDASIVEVAASGER
ncbi:spermidine synthase [Conexibacter woesei]|uniref:Spermine synthase n=1 Tax=Conexibacter woesei (strain DSM 14684 / CCUG 47730 / CIP 108061 / JCM 11494 / NBRC 100937 / ID131577) TaxID=469383 RepID=D3F013_CONWI|nr:fused MFS/spermidine synthase [Conexibacter woesei]ADB49989.1 Spermine synthase [Conexibacter woesei DSM 14684]